MMNEGAAFILTEQEKDVASRTVRSALASATTP
jgi:hypothetical protein